MSLTQLSKTTFRPKKSDAGTKLGQLKQYAQATLGTGSLRQAVLLPEGEDEDEWLAVNSTWLHSMHSMYELIADSGRFLQSD